MGFAFIGIIAILVIGLPIQNMSREQPTQTSSSITPAISDMKVLDIGLTGLSLKWAPGQEEVTTYKIYKDSILLATVPESIHEYKVNGLKANTWYQFSVEACGISDNCGKGHAVGVNTLAVQEATESVINDVNNLISTSVLSPKQGDALINELASIYKLDTDNADAVVKHLQAAINNADSLINAGVLSPEVGRPLVDAIDDIIRNIT